jgi:AraC family transcriptional regulator
MRPIDRTVWYVESHLNRTVSLDDTAKIAGLSKFALARAFLATTGHTVLAYARARRLSEAAKSLEEGAPSILDVALSVGYASHEAFSRAFRGQFGVTPVEARHRRHSLLLTEAIDMSNDPTRPALSPRFEDRKAFKVVGSPRLDAEHLRNSGPMAKLQSAYRLYSWRGSGRRVRRLLQSRRRLL